jgi:peptidyl-prolyl cis-trans isomerase A (cyclophilin A)
MLSDKQWEYYKNYIGAAHIDGEHTVFGQIIEGYSIVPKLTDVNTDTRDLTLTDLFIDSVIVR